MAWRSSWKCFRKLEFLSRPFWKTKKRNFRWARLFIVKTRFKICNDSCDRCATCDLKLCDWLLQRREEIIALVGRLLMGFPKGTSLLVSSIAERLAQDENFDKRYVTRCSVIGTLPRHARLVTVWCEALGTMRPVAYLGEWVVRLTQRCQHQDGKELGSSSMANVSESSKASWLSTSQSCW